MLKVILPLVVLLSLAAYFMISGSDSDSGIDTAANQTTAQEQTAESTQAEAPDQNAAPQAPVQAVEDDNNGNIYDEDIIPAAKAYASAEEAYQKLIASADDYDDIVLEQFAEPGADCTWCSELYEAVKDKMFNTDDDNLKSYLAEMLSITGKTENIETLLTAYNETTNEDDKEIYLEALEYTAGDDQLVSFLSTQLNTEDPEMQEAVVAAISNHGSTTAIESLYNKTVENGDADGFYALGIGLGEVIPEREGLPVLEQYAAKGDQYSHLAVKALLNYGDEGLEKVVGILESSGDQQLNQKLLEDAVDHVAFDENTEQIVKDIQVRTNNPEVKKFMDEILEDMELFNEGEDEDLDEDE